MGSLQFDDDSEENTKDLRFSRVSSSESYRESVSGLKWLCYPGEALKGCLNHILAEDIR